MNPARLHALFNAYLEPQKHRTALSEAPQPEVERSLASFFMGGL